MTISTISDAKQFWRSVGMAFSGMAAAQAIPLLASLIITRLYAPIEFGQFAAWLGMVALAAVIVTGRFELALAVEPDGEPRRLAVQAAQATIAIVCVPLSIAVVGSYLSVSSLQNLPTTLIVLFVPATFLTAFLQVRQSWAAAEGGYRKLSWIRIWQALGISGGQIIIGWVTSPAVSGMAYGYIIVVLAGFWQALGISGEQITIGWFTSPTASGMAYGYVIGVLASFFVAKYLMPIGTRTPIKSRSYWHFLKHFWIQHYRFPLFSLPADAINTASSQLPLLIITTRFGAESAGLYALTMRVMGAPIGLLGAAILDVFKRTAAINYLQNGSCKKEYLRTFWVLASGGVLLVVGVVFVSEPLFVFAFGEPWREAGTIAIWLIPLFALRFVASPLSYVFYITGKQHIDLVWQIGLCFMTFAAFFASKNFESSVKTYSIGYSSEIVNVVVASTVDAYANFRV
jgi:O-antigen/teichoic acid export membrane protein